MKDTVEKNINYNFNNLDIPTLKNILMDFGFSKDFLVLPFLGYEEDIKTLFFQSETSNKSIVMYEGKHLFIKEIPWYCSDQNYIEMVYNRAYNAIRECSNKIPFLYKQSLNDQYYTKVNGKFYIVMDYIHSECYDKSKEQAYDVANELAIIHKNFISQKDENFYKTVYSSSKDMIILAGKKELLEKLEESKTKLTNYDNICTLVYGDSTPSNYLFKDGRLTGVIDFDNVKYDNPVRDLAETIISFSIVEYVGNTSSYKKIFNPIKVDAATVILEGYKKGLNDDKLFSEIIINLIATIEVLLLLFYSLAFLKNYDSYNEEYNLEVVQLGLLENELRQYL